MKDYVVLMKAKKQISDGDGEIESGEEFDEVFKARNNPHAQILAGNLYGLDVIQVLEVNLLEESKPYDINFTDAAKETLKNNPEVLEAFKRLDLEEDDEN